MPVVNGKASSARDDRRGLLLPAWVCEYAGVLLPLAVLGVLAVTIIPVPHDPNYQRFVWVGDFPGFFRTHRLIDFLVPVGGNVLLLIPLGFLAPIRIPALADWRRVALAGLVFSAGIETTQFLMDAGRVASVDDVLLNTVGGLAGYGLLQLLAVAYGFWRRAAPATRQGREHG